MINSLYDFEKLIKVNGPAHRGARMPAAVDVAINQSKMPDNMRPKHYQVDILDENSIQLYWMTQEPFTTGDAEEALEEVKRAIKAIVRANDYTERLNVHVTFECRDGAAEGYEDFTFTINDETKKENINIRESLNRLDAATCNDYDLLNTYNSVALNEERKATLAKMLREHVDAKKIARFLINESQSKDLKESLNESDDFDWSIYDDYGYDDYEDDWDHANTYGGDLTDCPICGRRLSYDEDGETYCDRCGEDAHILAMQRRERDKAADVKEDFSYEDSEFFTKEEVADFAEKVCDHVNETFNEHFDVQEYYLTDNKLEVILYNDELGEFTGTKKIDMRRIRKISDLDKYVLDIAADIIEEIKEVLIDSDYHDADEDELRKMGVFDDNLDLTEEVSGADVKGIANQVATGVNDLSSDKEKAAALGQLVDSVSEDDCQGLIDMIKDLVGELKLNAEARKYAKEQGIEADNLETIGDLIDFGLKVFDNKKVGNGIKIIIKIVFTALLVFGLLNGPMDGFIIEIVSAIVLLIPGDMILKVLYALPWLALKGGKKLVRGAQAKKKAKAAQTADIKEDFSDEDSQVIMIDPFNPDIEDNTDIIFAEDYIHMDIDLVDEMLASDFGIEDFKNHVDDYGLVIEDNKLVIPEGAKAHFITSDDYGSYITFSSDTDKFLLEFDEPFKVTLSALEESVRYPNGEEVTDIDLDKALDYQYGTDRDPDNSKYTEEEKQKAVNYWLKKTDPSPYDESLTEDSDDNGPYSYKETEAELQSLTQNWTIEKDQLKCGYDEEKNYGMEILSKHGYECKADRQGGWWIVDYWKESLKENKSDIIDSQNEEITFDVLDENEEVIKTFNGRDYDKLIEFVNTNPDAYFVEKHEPVEVDGFGYEEPEMQVSSYYVFDRSEDDSLTYEMLRECLKEDWRWEPEFKTEDGWTEEDIAKWKEIDWAPLLKQHIGEVAIPEDNFMGKAVLYGDGYKPQYKEVKFVKKLHSNPIYPPNYEPEENPFPEHCGPMYDGTQHNGLMVHDRYETWSNYDMLSR